MTLRFSWRTIEGWVALLLGGVVLCYAGLLRRAHWQGDEYAVFALQHVQGWHFLLHWYFGWSPRLISDVFYAAYGAAVLHLHRPLAGTCMALLWAGLLLACLLPALRRKPDRPARLVMGLGLFALCLTGHQIAEVFYWPAGGLSYVPTLAGTVWLFWCLADGLKDRAWQAALALSVIAGSSEVGVFLALAFAACVMAGPWRQEAPAWLLPGTALAVLDIGLVLHFRVTKIENPSGQAVLIHHIVTSLRAALSAFPRELVVPDSEATGRAAWLWSLMARVFILLSARWSLGKAGARGTSLLLPYAAALLVAAFATLAAAFYDFGELCCQRHDTMRACCIVLACAALGAWSVRLKKPAAPQGLGAVGWLAAVLVLFVPRVPGILADWRSAPIAVAAHAQTWISGSAPGEAMVYVNPPDGHVTGTDGIPSGQYAKYDKPLAWYAAGILDFFGKSRLTILPVPPENPAPTERRK